MNIQQMRYVLEVEKTGSISRAASNLFMGQPNLSKAIKELEASLGIRIFKRTPKGVVATASGGQFLNEIRGVIEQIESIESRYRQNQMKEQSLLVSVPHCWYFSSAFTMFVRSLNSEDEMDLAFNEADSITAINNVVQGKQHVGFIRYHVDCEPFFMQLLAEQNLKHKLIWEFENHILISKSHQLANAQSVTNAELADYIELSHGGCSAAKSLQNARCGAIKPVSKRKIRVREFGNQLDFLANEPHAYMWAPIMPQKVLEHNGLVQKSCSNIQSRCRDVFITPHGHVKTPLEKLFLEKLQIQLKMAKES